MEELLNRIDELEKQLAERNVYSYDDYDMQGGRVVPKMNVMNCHELMNLTDEMRLVSNRQLKDSLVFSLVDEKYRITVAGNKVKVIPNEKDIMQFELSGMALSGKKKLIVVQAIMIHSDLLGTNSSNGWDMYHIRYNNREYNVGFMTTDQNTVCFMKDYVEYSWKPNVDDYYKVIRSEHNKGKTQVHNSYDMNDEVYLHEQRELAIEQVTYWDEMINELHNSR